MNKQQIVNELKHLAEQAKQQNGTTELNVGYITGLKQAAYILQKEINNENAIRFDFYLDNHQTNG